MKEELLKENNKLNTSYLTCLKKKLNKNEFNNFILNIFLNDSDTHLKDELFYYLLDINYDEIIINLFKKEYNYYSFNKIKYNESLLNYISFVEDKVLIDYIKEEKSSLDIINYLLLNKNEDFLKSLSSYFLKITQPFDKYITYMLTINETKCSFNYDFSKNLLSFTDNKNNPYLYYEENIFFYLFILKHIYLKENNLDNYLNITKCLNSYDLEFQLLSLLNNKTAFKELFLNKNENLNVSFLYLFSEYILSLKDDKVIDKVNNLIKNELESNSNSFNILISLLTAYKYKYYVNYFKVIKDIKEDNYFNFFLMFSSLNKVSLFDEKKKKEN